MRWVAEVRLQATTSRSERLPWAVVEEEAELVGDWPRDGASRPRSAEGEGGVLTAPNFKEQHFLPIETRERVLKDNSETKK